MNSQIYELVKYCDARTPKFTLRTSVGDVQFENPEELLSLAKFRAKFFGQTNHSVEIPRNKWGGIRKSWNLIIREVQASRENTIEGRMEIYLTEFLEDRPHRDMHQAVSGQHPFVNNGHWYIYMDTFKRWALMKKGINQDFKVDMKSIGCHEKRIQPRNPHNEKRRTSRYCWKIPKKIIRPSPDDSGSAAMINNVVPIRKEG